MNTASELIHVPTGPPDGSPADVLASSWRVSGMPPVYNHPQAVSRYAIGSSTPGPQPVRFNGVGYEA